MHATLVYDLLMILTAGLAAGLVCRRLQISVLPGYLIAGALLGQGGLGWVTDDAHEIAYLAEAGVFLLLFAIGLEFSLDELLRLGRDLVIGGSVQMTAVALPVAVLLLAIGYGWQPAWVIAAAVAFSSTVLVFKALTEEGHASLPHGRRAIGILLFQDAALIPLLLLIPLLTGTGQPVSLRSYLELAVVSAMFLLAVVGLRRALGSWIIPLFASYRSRELVVLFTLTSLGAVTLAAYRLGLPPAIGAFAAGLIFNGNRWTKQIDALVLPFRDTFAAVFFVSLGLLFDPRLVVQDPWLMLAGFIGLILLKALAATLALRLTGLAWPTALGMGVGLAHVGEFAFVLLLLAQHAGVVTSADYHRIVALAIGSLILTPLLLKTGLRGIPPVEEAAGGPRLGDLLSGTGPPAVVIGAGAIGRQVTSRLETAGKDVCLIDLSPLNLHLFAQLGFRTVAGDATELAILRNAAVEEIALAVVCVPDDDVACRIVKNIRTLNPGCVVLVRCRYQNNVPKLTHLRADRVVSEEAQATDALLRIFDELDQEAETSQPGPPGARR